jgi:CubicO group peptidase (beta-lactamase class C family)
MSGDKVLSRISDVMDGQVEAGELSGAITAIALKGEVVHFATHGWRDLENRTPMPADAIFRMASSTKPVVGVAVMQQIERGTVDPDAPVHRYIPEFRDTKVAVWKEGRRPAREGESPTAPTVDLGAAASPTDLLGAGRPAVDPDDVDLVPVHRDVLVRDLLTHTSGLLSGGLGAAVTDVRRTREDTLATYIPRLGQVPLDFQPGTRWKYSPGTGIDVLGHIVERVSNQPLDEYLAEHIFQPTGMVDTHFALPDHKKDRLLPLYRKTEDQGLVQADPRLANRMSSTHYFSGSGGLLSTAGDYLRFERMLTNGGTTVEGTQVLAPDTVRLMATNHVGDLFRGIREPVAGIGFGYTVQVVLDAAAARSARSEGAFGWGGAFGTMTWSDPARQLSGVYFVQQPNLRIRAKFERVVRAAVDELEGVTVPA